MLCWDMQRIIRIITINTDDLLIFDSSIENEYLLLYQAGALSIEQLEEIRLRGLETYEN